MHPSPTRRMEYDDVFSLERKKGGVFGYRFVVVPDFPIKLTKSSKFSLDLDWVRDLCLVGIGMAEGSGAGEAASGDRKLEFTPTWIVAAVCFIIILISLFVERLLHHLGKVVFSLSPFLFPAHSTLWNLAIFQVLKRKNQKPLFDALQKVKEGTFAAISSFSP